MEERKADSDYCGTLRCGSNPVEVHSTCSKISDKVENNTIIGNI